MNDQPKDADLKELLNGGAEDLQNKNVVSMENLHSFFANAAKKRELILSRIRDGAFCINQANHEINANNMLATELQETAKEEEKKLAEYPEQMAQLDKEMEETTKGIGLRLKEKEALQPQKFIIKNKWEDKLNALAEVLGFVTDARAQNVFLKYKDICGTVLRDKKDHVNLFLKEGSYEVSEASAQVESVENHIRKLNRGMPFSSFCCELKKSIEDNE